MKKLEINSMDNIAGGFCFFAILHLAVSLNGVSGAVHVVTCWFGVES